MVQLEVEIFGIKFWEESKEQFLSQLGDDLKTGSKVWVATVNPEFIVEAKRERRFEKILTTKTTYNVVDGIGLLWAAGVMNKGKNWIEKIGSIWLFFVTGKDRDRLIAGIDLMEDLIKIAVEEKLPVFFLGGWEPQKVAQYFKDKFSRLDVGGWSGGKFVETLENRKCKKAIIFLALGMKKQEYWIEDNWEKVPGGIIVGVGRSFDYLSGSIRRAPGWIRRLGMEWLFSALIDLKRAKRQCRNLPEFIKMVMYEPRH